MKKEDKEEQQVSEEPPAEEQTAETVAEEATTEEESADKELEEILAEEEQLCLFDVFKEYYQELPFKPNKTGNLRYFFENPYYLYSDAIFLYCMIRYTKPKRIVEVGSGYSSCLIIDTNELFFGNSIHCTFIDPFPQNLLSLINEDDKDKIKIITKKLQDVDLDEFTALAKGDILFIDSTHVSKIDSDVNYVFFTILPNLKSGVYIHFHDIFYHH